MKPAEWTLHPVSERDAALASRRARGWRRTAWGLSLGSLGLCPVSLLGLIEYGGIGLFGFLLSFGLLVYVLVRSVREVEKLRAERIRLQEEHAAVQGWIVDLAVTQGAALTGRDRGVVWFEEGRLLFVGRRTSFALAAEAVSGALALGWWSSSSTLPLRAHTAAGAVALTFEMMPPDNLADSRSEYAFAEALQGWQAAHAPVESGLPPLAVGPGAPSVASLLGAAMATTAIWLALGGGFVLMAVRLNLYLAFTIGIVGASLLAGLPDLWRMGYRWRAYRDRLRLEKEAR